MTPEKDDSKRLNPQIASVKIGVRNLRTIKIYPLSMAHHKKLTEKVVTVISAFAELDESVDAMVTISSFALNFVMENLEVILSMATEEDPAKLMDQITAEQAQEIGAIIYQQNYEGLKKKVQKLLKEKLASLTRRLSQPSSSDTTSTDLTTSTVLDSEKVD